MTVKDTVFQRLPLVTEGSLQVRLVTILAGQSTSPIHCTLSMITLSADSSENDNACTVPDYEALSYTWGDEGYNRGVSIDGEIILVTENLRNALTQLRYATQSRTLWVDAICLDQNNETEKRHQIPIMHIIYAQATKIIVWLGDPSDDSDLAMRYILDIHSLVEPGKEEEVSDTHKPSTWPLTLIPRAPWSLHAISSAFALYRLLDRPWWKRAWIVQEISFAKDASFMCGFKSVTWTQMRVAMHMMRICFEQLKSYSEEEEKGRLENPLIGSRPAPIINNALDLLYHRERTQKKRPEQTESLATELSWCLGLNKARLCREPQDRTFSVLGFAGKTFRDQIQPDYRKSPEEHYRSVVYWFVMATGSFDVILHTQHTAWPYSGSSWAPDWELAERAAVFHQNQQGLSKMMAIADRGDFSISPGSPILRIKGVDLGTVSAIKLEYGVLLDPAQPYYDVTTITEADEDLPRRARVWWEFRYAEHNEGRLLNDTIPYLPGNSPLWKKHLELFLGVVATKWYPDACGSFNEEWGKEFVEEQLPAEEHFGGVEDFWDLLIYLLTSRTVCATTKGTLVLALNYARPGDRIALLVGCSNPVLLRPQIDGTYVLLGDAHVLGLNPNTIDRNTLVEMVLV